MAAMMNLDQLAQLLKTVNVVEVANAAKVSEKTIYRLRHKATNPSLATVERIVVAARKLQARKGAKVAA